MDKLNLVRVEDEYKKFKEIKKEDVAKLLDWIKKQPHLPKITELEVIIFLHSNYCNIEPTKNTIEAYYTCRTHVEDFFWNRDILSKDMQNAMNLIMFSPLPTLTPEGYKVIFCKLTDYDTKHFSLGDILKLLVFCLDLWLLEEGTAQGHVIVYDMTGLNIGHLAKLGIMTIKKFLYYLQDALPVRLKGLHFTNIVPFMDKIMMLMKPFMKKELQESFVLHSTNETLYPYVPQKCLPSDFGGTADTVINLKRKYFDHMVTHREFFLEEEKTRRVNEKKRRGKPKTVSDIFGIEGNFKKLDID